jgi:DNA-binding beta-propeller fold protein YncE
MHIQPFSLRLLLLSSLVSAPVLAQTAQQAAPLKLVQTFRLPDTIRGHFDHLIVDLKTNRLFLTAEDAKCVPVFNIESGKLIHTIEGFGRPHALLYRQDINRLFVTDGGDGDLKVFDGTSYQPLGKVPLLKDADSIGYDPSTKYLYIDNGGGDVGASYSMLTSVDTSASRKVHDLKIDGDTLEAMALDPYRSQLYVNNKAKNEITVVNRWQGKIIANWPVTLGKTNVALAFDEPNSRLFVACRSGQLVVFDANTGKELQALPITKGVDDLAYDGPSKRLYAAADGAVDVYQQVDADRYKLLGNVPSGPLGRTARLVPELSRYFVSVPQHDSTPASVLVYETVGVPVFKAKQDQVAYEVHAPAAEGLVRSTLSNHPAIRKIGLHAVQPGQKDSVIIANGNATRIGIKSTDGDFDAVKSGKIYCANKDKGGFYNMKMPMFDAAGRRIGMLMMEIPYTSAADDAAATQMADNIRSEMEKQIPDLASLFADK